MTDRQGIYDAKGDAAKCQKNEPIMIESCARAIDFEKLDHVLIGEYMVKP